MKATQKWFRLVDYFCRAALVLFLHAYVLGFLDSTQSTEMAIALCGELQIRDAHSEAHQRVTP